MESLLIVKQPGAQKKLTDEQETELLCVISTIRTNFTKSKEAAVGYVFVFQ